MIELTIGGFAMQIPAAQHLGAQNPLERVSVQVDQQTVFQNHGGMQDAAQPGMVVVNFGQHRANIFGFGDISRELKLLCDFYDIECFNPDES